MTIFAALAMAIVVTAIIVIATLLLPSAVTMMARFGIARSAVVYLVHMVIARLFAACDHTAPLMTGGIGRGGSRQ